jgi:hypothetical protein
MIETNHKISYNKKKKKHKRHSKNHNFQKITSKKHHIWKRSDILILVNITTMECKILFMCSEDMISKKEYLIAARNIVFHKVSKYFIYEDSWS